MQEGEPARPATTRPLVRARSAWRFARILALALALAHTPIDPTRADSHAKPESSSQPERTLPRIVVLYAPCTVSKQFLSPYDPRVPYTPNFARLAAEGVTFEAHRTEAGSSGIAYAALFSGTQVDRHGVAAHPTALRDDLYLISEAFADAGYSTYYWNKQVMATAKLGYAPGVARRHVIRRPLRGGSPQFQRLLRDLRANPQERAFVMASFSLTHGPYRSESLPTFLERFPGERGELDSKRRDELVELYQRNYLRLAYNFPDVLEGLSLSRADVPALADAIERLYTSNVWRLDEALGTVLDAIDEHGLHDASVVAVTADHGEVLYREHEVFPWTHSSSLAPEVIEVPLIIRAPGVAPGRYAGVTRSIDVFPTLLGLVGLPLPADRGVQGVELAEVLYGRKPPPVLTAYSHTGALAKPVVGKMTAPGARESWGRRLEQYPTGDFRHSSTVLRRGDLVVKLMSIDGESFELLAFDHKSDPYEAVDVFDAANPLHADAARDLRQYKAKLDRSVGARLRKPSKRDPTEQEVEEALRALGYIE